MASTKASARLASNKHTMPALPTAANVNTATQNDVDMGDRENVDNSVATSNNSKRKRAANPTKTKKGKKSDRSKTDTAGVDDEAASESTPKEKHKSKDAGKGKQNDSEDESDKPKKAPPPDNVIRVMIDGVKNVVDWTSTTVDADYCEIIKMFDHDGCTGAQVEEFWFNKGHGNTNKKSKAREKNVYKHYSTYGRKFYAERGIQFVGLNARKLFLGREKKADAAAKKAAEKAAIQANKPQQRKAAATKPKGAATTKVKDAATAAAKNRKTGTKPGTLNRAKHTEPTQFDAPSAPKARAEPDKVINYGDLDELEDSPGSAREGGLYEPGDLRVSSQEAMEVQEGDAPVSSHGEMEVQEDQAKSREAYKPSEAPINSQAARYLQDVEMDSDEESSSEEEEEDGSEQDSDSDSDSDFNSNNNDHDDEAPRAEDADLIPLHVLRKLEPKEPIITAEDLHLQNLFRLTVPEEGSEDHIAWKPQSHHSFSNRAPSNKDIARVHANRNAINVLLFARTPGDAPLWGPSHSVLDRQVAAEYAPRLRKELEGTADLARVEYDHDAVDTETVSRYVACISPTVRAEGLPTHDIVEVAVDGEREMQCTAIQWSPKKLVAMYRFAWYMGTRDICDMVMDRLHQDFHRGAVRVAELDPAFLNELLVEEDERGLDFFTDLLVVSKQAGWNALERYGLEKWDERVKEILKNKLESGVEPVVASQWWMNSDASTNKDGVCHRFHHHDDIFDLCYRDQGPEVEAAPLPKTDRDAWYWKRQVDHHASQLEAKQFAKQRQDALAFEKAKTMQTQRMQMRLDSTYSPTFERELTAEIKACQTAAAQRLATRMREDEARTRDFWSRSAAREQEMQALEDAEDDMPYLSFQPPSFRPTPLIRHPTTSPLLNELPYSEWPTPTPFVKPSFCNPYYAEIPNSYHKNTVRRVKMYFLAKKYRAFQVHYGYKETAEVDGEPPKGCGDENKVNRLIEKAGGIKGPNKEKVRQGRVEKKKKTTLTFNTTSDPTSCDYNTDAHRRRRPPKHARNDDTPLFIDWRSSFLHEHGLFLAALEEDLPLPSLTLPTTITPEAPYEDPSFEEMASLFEPKMREQLLRQFNKTMVRIELDMEEQFAFKNRSQAFIDKRKDKPPRPAGGTAPRKSFRDEALDSLERSTQAEQHSQPIPAEEQDTVNTIEIEMVCPERRALREEDYESDPDPVWSLVLPECHKKHETLPAATRTALYDRMKNY
ncbi:hypothetical protein CC86DRAFT_381179 [Ophiobolus disseminans]|uniref:Uncharacterized protein n=1 Tax=Ophiobolus disseminans TaxID=1469910 RepID=A0A6A7A4K4_9PLEO|nr:hypothetical protein CC86DRAFT_381179 [Ophiobolus disseminans]